MYGYENIFVVYLRGQQNVFKQRLVEDNTTIKRGSFQEHRGMMMMRYLVYFFWRLKFASSMLWAAQYLGSINMERSEKLYILK